ncbi:MAG: alpha/beta fold hydrolase [Deltaproteobacteria bacterium]|nr:MAG: alpha/beta fold hydrolase [Deltaproteobacteria bacterium]
MGASERILSALERIRPFSTPPGRLDAPMRQVVRARDGVHLVVRRRPPAGPGAGEGRVVMLLHGLAANACAYDFPGRSLSGYLARRGYDVWMPELRGHGESERPHLRWTFTDYLQQDLPAIVEHIRAESGTREIAWVGHSMGGILLMCWGILHPSDPVTRGIAVGSALDYRVGATGFRTLLRLRPLLERLPALPYGTLAHLLSPLNGRIRALDTFNVWPENIEPENTRRLHAGCFHTVPVSLLASLATTFEPGGLRTTGGFRFLEHTGDYRIPTLLIGGSKDAQVAPEAIVHTARLLRASVRLFGRAHGQPTDYGHWDLLIGRRAPEEVWPVLEHFLRSVPRPGEVGRGKSAEGEEGQTHATGGDAGPSRPGAGAETGGRAEAGTRPKAGPNQTSSK